MNPFTFEKPANLAAAIEAKEGAKKGREFLAGGTTIVDLMRIGVRSPSSLVSLDPVTSRTIEQLPEGLRIGAGVRMSQLADDENVRERMPMVRHSLLLAASPQIRNMASIGGNLLQRTRCPYFRDISQPCNKRDPGTGCSAIDPKADNRSLAVLGTSDSCIAHYPGDFAVAAIALDAAISIRGVAGERNMKLREFYKLPGDTPHIENELKAGEIITGITIPEGACAENSLYYKVRERSSYAFALVSVAVGIEMDGDTIREARVALGGVGSVPWHSPEAEAALLDKPATAETFSAAAEAALAGASTQPLNAYKVPLARRAIVRALTSLIATDATEREANLWRAQHGR